MTSVLEARAVALAPSRIAGALRAPASKSMTNRALVAAALADGRSRLADVVESEDVMAMRAGVTALGARVARSSAALEIDGTAGRLASPGEIDARASGTTMRFLTAVAALTPNAVRITGDPALLRRPVGPLIRALRQLGASAEDRDGFPPVTVGGGLRGGHVTVDVAASSQFASAVLLASPYAESDVAVTTRGATADDYIAMTVDVMTRWGAAVTGDGGTWHISAGQGYTPRHEAVEYDASAAAHLYALAAAGGGSVTVTNATATTLQPDARLPGVLAAMGCAVREEEGAISVTGPDALRPLDVDVSGMPDQVTTVAALAALAGGTSSIRGASVTRGHETDRLAALATELGKCGVAVDERPDGLVIHGGTVSPSSPLETYGDHRLAMAFAALGMGVRGVIVADPGCVAKTYPRFWDDLVHLGGSLQVVA